MPAYAIDGVIPVVDPTAFVHPTAVLIGDVVIGAGCYIGPGASLRGDMGRITVAAGANVQDGCVLHCFPGRETSVGPSGHIGHRATLHGCQIGHGALIGIGATVMDGARIGAHALVGAHSFVPADTTVRDGYLALGSPAKEVRALRDAEIAWQSNGPMVYQELAARSLASLKETDPLYALPPGPRQLGVRRERAVPLREYRDLAGHEGSRSWPR
ncbi:phenylacetic acid degradation protein PaaY [Trebonia kvetii]|uniref:Phenylacetic acid degradation protein PaaY n=1 Tax=Trebonia kvetii TaxID=2480626 RepID=A0A6P2BSU1_9ACTN|nr:phenylacetic acid degradation protein PaaY [Trebonia kvetii]TVZ02132.1 phenylacetic acid degradation protein PaaY [Trebonia kvetii]